MNIVYRKNLERILSVTEIDGNFEQLEAAVLLLQAASSGTLFEFESTTEAMAVTPLPANNVPFIVRGSANGTEDGYYIYNSNETGGYFKTGDFKTPGLTQTLEPTNTTEAPSNKAVSDALELKSDIDNTFTRSEYLVNDLVIYGNISRNTGSNRLDIPFMPISQNGFLTEFIAELVGDDVGRTAKFYILTKIGETTDFTVDYIGDVFSCENKGLYKDVLSEPIKVSAEQYIGLTVYNSSVEFGFRNWYTGSSSHDNYGGWTITVLPTNIGDIVSTTYVQNTQQLYMIRAIVKSNSTDNPIFYKKNDWNETFCNSETSLNLFDKTKYVEGYYGGNGVTFGEHTFYWTTDFIDVTEGMIYKRTTADFNAYVYAYDSNKIPFEISLDKYYWGEGDDFESVSIPVGCKYIRAIFRSPELNSFMFTLNNTDTSVYLPFYENKLEFKEQYLPDAIQPISVVPNNYDISDVGVLDYQEVESDYSHIILYGQSLSMGWQSPRAITTVADDGVFMVGTRPYYFSDNTSATGLNPLVAVQSGSVGEQPIVSLTNDFAKLFKRFVDKNQLFIGSNPSQDGRSIEQLSKECTNGDTIPNNIYNTRYVKLLNDTKSIIDGLGKTVSIPALIWMQGEFNYEPNLTDRGLTDGTDATNDKDTYKAYLLTLKNNMQNDAMSIYGQSKKPLFFIYQVAGGYITSKDMSINMAQIEFAQENDDVFLLNPTYFVSDYNGGHLSTNGYRWYGETMAKSLYNVLVKGVEFEPIKPMNYEVDGCKLNIDFKVPKLPLVFDTYTTTSIANNGFQILVDNVEVNINNIEIVNNRVVLSCDTELIGNVEVIYAGFGRSGSGNLRDSDTWKSKYTYFNDVGDSPFETYTPTLDGGGSIYGEKYPMQNWCVSFYKLIVV